MKAPKIVAWGLASALAASAVVAIAAPAQAYSGAEDLRCRLYFSDAGTGSSPQSYADTFSLTQSPSAPGVGQTVNLTFSGANGATTGPAELEANSQVVRATIDVSGAQTATVDAVSTTPYPAAHVNAYSSIGAYSATGSYVASTAGSTTAALKLLKFDDKSAVNGGSGFNVDTYCSDVASDADIKASGGTVSPTIAQTYTQTAFGAQIDSVTDNGDTVIVANPQPIRVGATINVSSGGNTGWTPSTTVRTTICTDAALTSCAPTFTEAGIFGGAVTADATGAVVPTPVTALSFSSFTGLNYMVLYQGANVGAATNKVAFPVYLTPSPRTAATTATAINPGTSITVTGTNFYPGETVTLKGNRTGSDGLGTDTVQTVANGTGAISQAITINDPLTTSVRAKGAGAAVSTSAIDVTNLNGTFIRSAGSIYATQSIKLTPKNVTADVNTISINWGDGKVSAGSKTAAVSHTYTSTGTKVIKVTLKNTAMNYTKVLTVGSVAVKADKAKPVPTLTTPSNPTRGSSWKTVKGKVTDTGLGAKSVTVYLIQKKGGKWYYFKSGSWKKTTSKSKALAKAQKLTDTSVSTKAWSVKVSKKPAKSTLYVYYFATDKAGNKSLPKYKKQTIKS